MCRLFGMTSGTQPTTRRSGSSTRRTASSGRASASRTGPASAVRRARRGPRQQAAARRARRQALRTRGPRDPLAYLPRPHPLRLDRAAARENTHPFELEHRLFAHNGAFGDLPTLDAELGAALAHVHGQTDSERAFALITKRIDEQGGDVEAGITAAVTWIAEQLPLYALNFVLTSADELWALRYPQTHELYVLERDAGEELHHRSRLGRTSIPPTLAMSARRGRQRADGRRPRLAAT